MAGRIILETERLLLREFDEGDVEPFYRMGSDPAVIRYTGDPGGGLTSREHALEVLRSRPMADYRKYGYGRLACVLKATGEVIGFAGLKYLDDVQEVDLGYRLLPAYWGRGLATEACRAILDYGRTRLRLGRIIGLVDPENVASVRVLEKLGLTPDGQVEYQGMCLARYVLEQTPALGSLSGG
jgi:RimJ/RimL family protein N-acetyltransferase